MQQQDIITNSLIVNFEHKLLTMKIIFTTLGRKIKQILAALLLQRCPRFYSREKVKSKISIGLPIEDSMAHYS